MTERERERERGWMGEGRGERKQTDENDEMKTRAAVFNTI